MLIHGKTAVQYLLAISGVPPRLQPMTRQATSPGMAMPPPSDFSALFERVAPHMAALDRFMRREVEHFEPEIRGMAAYCLDTTGKRLRPTMVFVSGWQGELARGQVGAERLADALLLADKIYQVVINLIGDA